MPLCRSQSPTISGAKPARSRARAPRGVASERQATAWAVESRGMLQKRQENPRDIRRRAGASRMIGEGGGGGGGGGGCGLKVCSPSGA